MFDYKQRAATNEYRDNWDTIFGGNKKSKESKDTKKKEKSGKTYFNWEKK